MYIQTKSYDDIIDLALNKEMMMAAIPAIQPIHNIELTRLASGFGMRISERATDSSGTSPYRNFGDYLGQMTDGPTTESSGGGNSN